MYKWSVVSIGSIIIFHLSKLWKPKFFILWVVIFLVQAAGETWNWSLLGVKGLFAEFWLINDNKVNISWFRLMCLGYLYKHRMRKYKLTNSWLQNSCEGPTFLPWLLRHLQSSTALHTIIRLVPSLKKIIPLKIAQSSTNVDWIWKFESGDLIRHQLNVDTVVWCHGVDVYRWVGEIRGLLTYKT